MNLAITVSSAALIFLSLLGMISALTGGSSLLKGIFRVTFWGSLAMGITAGVGSLFGAVAT
jgi:VIT1/CCC1 family predicted Fe2+/Mn2+ transporter